jgi:pantothenate kinase type III
MKPSLVVDVGNSRIKWGLCQDPMLYSSLPPDDPAAWQQQMVAWGQTGPLTWAIAGVHPERRDRLAGWARQRGDTMWVLDDWHSLPLTVRLEHPEWVGIDPPCVLVGDLGSLNGTIIQAILIGVKGGGATR